MCTFFLWISVYHCLPIVLNGIAMTIWICSKEAGLRPVTGNRKAQGNISMNTSEAVQHKGMKSTTSYTDDDLDSEMESTVSDILPPPPPPFLSALSAERMVVNPILPPITSDRHAKKNVNSAEFFTIASLQQYTNSFSQDNLIGGGMLGTVYRAESPKKVSIFMFHQLHISRYCVTSSVSFHLFKVEITRYLY